ncbi:MAG TPA: glutaredoxin [Clostridiaceae bacterium]|nr:glutaredoxin [Clostridiaceae bacterium]
MSIFDQETKNQIVEIFKHMTDEVRVEAYDKNEETDMVTFLKEICSFSDKLNFVFYEPDSERARELEIERIPGINLTRADGQDLGVRFSGIPAGHEINSLIAGLLELGGSGSQLPEEIEERIANIEGPLDIKVFVTLQCPHCPGAVLKAHKLAMMNPNIKAEMVEAQTFPALSQEYNISAVPKTVFSNGTELLGDQPFERILEAAEGKTV